MAKSKIIYVLLFSLYIAIAVYSKPVLACRLLMLVSPNDVKTEQQKKIVERLLVKGKVSLLNQSNVGLKKKYIDLNTIEDVDGLYVKRGNPDGWGMVLYKDGHLKEVIKSIEPAYKDELYLTTAKDVSKKDSDILMTHIRLASDNMSVTEKNVHPFVNGNWAFMHNGFVDLKGSSVINDKMKAYKVEYNLYPQGNTDSETMFYYFLGKMADKRKGLNINNLSKKDIVDSFATSIMDFNQYCKTSFRNLVNNGTAYDGKVIMSPTMNLITTNGKVVMAYKQGKNLFLGMIKTKSNKGIYYIISSEIMEPVTKKDIQWYEIPDKSMLILDRETKDIDIFPIEYFAER